MKSVVLELLLERHGSYPSSDNDDETVVKEGEAPIFIMAYA